jgi:hypothetical protein
MELTPLVAYDLVRFAEGFHQRLAAAKERLLTTPGLEQEKRWMASALDLIAPLLDEAPPTLEGARSLPELTDVREDFVEELQNRWVDALERLLAGITYHAGARAPVVEALFPHQKFSALRRASRATASAYWLELERRLKSTYVQRMMKEPELSFAPEAVQAVQDARCALESCFSPPAPEAPAAQTARRALVELGAKLQGLTQQARLLAQAALLPLGGAFEISGLSGKPKKRATMSAGDETPRPPPFESEAADAQARS